PKSSRVSLDANFTGEGLSANNLAGSIRSTISGLEQNGKPLDPISINASLGRDETPEHQRVDVITSSIADLTLKGKYNIESLFSEIASKFSTLITAFRDRNMKDTMLAFSGPCVDSVDMNYAVNVKDLRPIAPFIPDMILLGSGKFAGKIVGCRNQEMNFSDSGDIHNFLM